jgi:phospholipid-binding lipoprotein MlaA
MGWLTGFARRRLALAGTLFMALSLSACVLPSTPEKIAQIEETGDPFEPTNRYIFELNRFLDEMVMKPTVGWYRMVVPDPIQDRITSVIANLRQPWTAINDFFQGNPDRAGSALARFAINSTVGILGMFDPATDMGYPAHEEDAGQTIGVIGVLSDQPYLMLPILGPSSPRDLIGTVLDAFLDPFNFIARKRDADTFFPTGRGIASGVDARHRTLEATNDLERNSVDYYATVRSIYRQRRNAAIRNGAPSNDFPGPAITQQSARQTAASGVAE